MTILENNEIYKRQIIELIKSLLTDYFSILTQEEITTINDIKDNLELYPYIILVNKLEIILKKVWDKELLSGKYKVISWNKYPRQKEKGEIIFATLSYGDEILSFCGLTDGIEYKINYESIIGASPKDGATVIEDESKTGEYTIGKVGNKVINSYNHSTRLITPRQLLDLNNNKYYSKYNELILNANLIEEIEPITIGKLM